MTKLEALKKQLKEEYFEELIKDDKSEFNRAFAYNSSNAFILGFDACLATVVKDLECSLKIIMKDYESLYETSDWSFDPIEQDKAYMQAVEALKKWDLSK